jgi:hypothetical protein
MILPKVFKVVKMLCDIVLTNRWGFYRAQALLQNGCAGKFTPAWRKVSVSFKFQHDSFAFAASSKFPLRRIQTLLKELLKIP